jgi:hypothetical protein
MNLDLESMKRILMRVKGFDKAQCNNKQHMSIRFSTNNIISKMLARAFFKINPRTKTSRAKIMSPSHISLANYLDEHVVLMKILFRSLKSIIKE